MEGPLVSLLQQQLSVKPFVSRDRYNKPVYGVAVLFAARLTFKPKLIRAADGQEKMSSGEAWLDVWPAIGLEDEVTLPDATVPPILRIDKLADTSGVPHHTVIFFG